MIFVCDYSLDLDKITIVSLQNANIPYSNPITTLQKHKSQSVLCTQKADLTSDDMEPPSPKYPQGASFVCEEQ